MRAPKTASSRAPTHAFRGLMPTRIRCINPSEDPLNGTITREKKESTTGLVKVLLAQRCGVHTRDQPPASSGQDAPVGCRGCSVACNKRAEGLRAPLSQTALGLGPAAKKKLRLPSRASEQASKRARAASQLPASSVQRRAQRTSKSPSSFQPHPFQRQLATGQAAESASRGHHRLFDLTTMTAARPQHRLL